MHNEGENILENILFNFLAGIMMTKGVWLSLSTKMREKAEMRAAIVLWSELRFRSDKPNFYQSNYGGRMGMWLRVGPQTQQ